MTKLISLLFVVLAVFVGYRLYLYWEKVDTERDLQEQRASRPLDPRQLPGMPYQLEDSLAKAQQGGGRAMREWLDAYGSQLQDPRLAWIQLDYCRLLILDNPNEAKQIFNAVKERTPTNSPVFPRIKQVEKTFE